MKNEKILLVDDEQDILDIISYNLSREGYQVITATNGVDALKLAKQESPELIILDVMMPEMDGMETCYELRKIESLKGTIITFLSARSEDYSQIAGLDSGADDYITKPIKPRVLLSKVKALLRRLEHVTDAEEEKIILGEIELDRSRYLLNKNQETIHLPKKEFELLELLMSKPGRVYTREKIMDKLWEGEVIVGDRTIDVHIRKLREKIGDSLIKTIKGVGYKFDLA